MRLIGCGLGCRYCDTPSAALPIQQEGMKDTRLLAQKGVDLNEYEEIPNPVSVRDLTGLCSRLVIAGPARPCISLTGGEPLLQAAFLAEWLPQAGKKFRIYLETNGISYDAMSSLKGMIDVASIDFKLPSATGLRPFWDEHRKFLTASAGLDYFVKAVVTRDTVLEDITTSARLISEVVPDTVLVIQPAAGALAPEPQTLIGFQNAALGIIKDARVIPQTHRMLNVP